MSSAQSKLDEEINSLQTEATLKLGADLGAQVLIGQLTSPDGKLAAAAANSLLDRGGFPKKEATPPLTQTQNNFDVKILMQGLKSLVEVTNGNSVQIESGAKADNADHEPRLEGVAKS